MSRVVLVTGAGGFIGRNVIPELLARGFDVHGTALRPPEANALGARWHALDMLDPAASARLFGDIRPSHWLHLAWYTEPRQYWTSIENLRWIDASTRALHAFHAHGGERVVMAGTCAEYDWRFGHCNERTTPTVPQMTYGAAKHALHVAVEEFCAKTGLSSAWGRIFYLYGPREHPSRLIPSVILALLRNEPAKCTHGNQVRDFLHVHDVASAFAAVLDSRHAGPVNIASGEPVTLHDVVMTVAAQLGRMDLVRFGEIPPPVGDPPVLVGDSGLLRGLDWAPRFDLVGGIANTIEWWKVSAPLSV
jgi:nucleoside-diphosphate-sugar epimerase